MERKQARRLKEASSPVVALLRGVNVGGHRTFRPSLLAQELAEHDVVNVGAAGTFVVRKPGDPARFRAALLAKLPFDTRVVLRKGDDILKLDAERPFGSAPPAPGITRFASFLSDGQAAELALPIMVPPGDDWLVRIIALSDGVAFGEYRRDLKTIRYLGQVEKLIGVPVTSRNWNTIDAIVRVLKGEASSVRAASTVDDGGFHPRRASRHRHHPHR